MEPYTATLLFKYSGFTRNSQRNRRASHPTRKIPRWLPERKLPNLHRTDTSSAVSTVLSLKRLFPTSFYKASKTLIPKSDKDSIIKEREGE